MNLKMVEDAMKIVGIIATKMVITAFRFEFYGNFIINIWTSGIVTGSELRAIRDLVKKLGYDIELGEIGTYDDGIRLEFRVEKLEEGGADEN